MVFEEILSFPFKVGFGLAIIIIGLALLIFWIWAIIDCAKRNFRNDLEKIIWILIIIFTSWVGALVYFIAVAHLNPKGVVKKR